MKRFSPRAFALLCAPIAFIAVVPFVSHLFTLARDPNARIAMNVNRTPVFFMPRPNYLQFAWRVEATGGPQRGYQLGFGEQIVAISDKGETLLFWQPSAAISPWLQERNTTVPAPTGIVSYQRDIQFPSLMIPLNTKRVEARIEVVAVPRGRGSSFDPEAPVTLARLAKVKGAARFRKRFPLHFDTLASAIPRFDERNVQPYSAPQGVDRYIAISTRAKARHVFRRLCAFAGRTWRTL